MHTDFSKPLSSLKQPSYLHHNLLAKCESISVEITSEMAAKDEEAIRSQSDSKVWFKYRAGWITASQMKAMRCTDLNIY